MFSQENFSARLKKLRKSSAIKQSELASAIGVTNKTISMIESGQRAASIEGMSAFADYFDVPIDYLLGRSLYVQTELINKHWDSIVAGLSHRLNDPTLVGFLDMPSVDDIGRIQILSAFVCKVQITEEPLKIEIEWKL